MKRRTTVFALVTALGLAAALPAFAAVNITETGSSLLYPLMNIWVKDYGQAHTDVQISTNSTGSGTGISQAMNGTAQIGASDAYLAPAQMAQQKMLNIPLAISAQQINYNIPELDARQHLKLSGPVLAAIYSGTIRYWDDRQIKDLNKDLASKLPHQTIIPVHRTDGSGDTFLFTSYLTDTAPSWKSGPGMGTSVSWPSVQGGVGAEGNPGMVDACRNAKYSIAYIGISFINETNKAGLGYAALQNKAGNFVLPTEDNIKAAAGALDKQTPDNEIISLINAPGANSYPIINYEYAIIKPDQSDSGVATALKNFLDWSVSANGGNQALYLNQVHFVPLPPAVSDLSKKQIAQIK